MNASAESAAQSLTVGGSGVQHKEHSSVGFRADSCML